LTINSTGSSSTPGPSGSSGTSGSGTTGQPIVVEGTPGTPKEKEPKVTQPRPSLWEKIRESWGKPESPKLPADSNKETDATKSVADSKKNPKPSESDTAKEPQKPAADTAKQTQPTPPPLGELPHYDPKKPDPLLGDPTETARKPLDAKLPPKGDLPPAAPAVPPAVAQTPPAPGAEGSTPKGGGPSADRDGPGHGPGAVEALPGGARSVTDSGAVNHVPYPVVSLPPIDFGPPPHPPGGPHIQLPPAPHPIAHPGGGPAPEAHPGGLYYNAFTPPELVPPKPGSAEQTAMANAFSSDLDPPRSAPHPMPAGPPMGGVFGPAGPYPMGPAHPYPPAMAPGGPYGPAPILPPAPYGPVVRIPEAPMPSNAMPQGTQLAMLPPAQDRGVVQASYQGPAPAGAMSTQQLGAMLHDALYPSQREWAAEKLSTYDWKQNEAAVQALTQALHDDPAATVRAACVRALARMKANTYPVVNAIQAARNDSDVRVRTEVDEALVILAPNTAPPAALPAAVQTNSPVTPPAAAPATGGPTLPTLTK
jgi:hypothetical protein